MLPAAQPFRRPLRPLPGWRVLGLGCALLVAMLSLAGASDLLHAHVHGHDEAHEHEAPAAEHACAITLFAHGAESPVDHAAFAVAPEETAVTTLRLAAVTAPAVVDRPLRPGRDPPAARTIA